MLTGAFNHLEAIDLGENSFGSVWVTKVSLEYVWERIRMYESEKVSVETSPEMYYKGEQSVGASEKVVMNCSF